MSGGLYRLIVRATPLTKPFKRIIQQREGLDISDNGEKHLNDASPYPSASYRRQV